MARRSRRNWPPPTFVEPPYVSNVHRPGDKGTSDPFHQFRNRARYDGKPAPVRESRFMTLLGSKAAVMVMWCLLVVVVVTVVALLVARA
jgi:hypothetical protein